MPKEKKVHKGEIWRISLGTQTTGHEQQGERPAVIVANITQVDMATIIPLTGNEERSRLAYTCIIKDSEISKIGLWDSSYFSVAFYK